MNNKCLCGDGLRNCLCYEQGKKNVLNRVVKLSMLRINSISSELVKTEFRILLKELMKE